MDDRILAGVIACTVVYTLIPHLCSSNHGPVGHSTFRIQLDGEVTRLQSGRVSSGAGVRLEVRLKFLSSLPTMVGARCPPARWRDVERLTTCPWTTHSGSFARCVPGPLLDAMEDQARGWRQGYPQAPLRMIPSARWASSLTAGQISPLNDKCGARIRERHAPWRTRS